MGCAFGFGVLGMARIGAWLALGRVLIGLGCWGSGEAVKEAWRGNIAQALDDALRAERGHEGSADASEHSHDAIAETLNDAVRPAHTGRQLAVVDAKLNANFFS